MPEPQKLTDTPVGSNVVIRNSNPGQGQGLMRAISARTAWEYEHDETDEQIDAIEELILTVREDEAVQAGDRDTKRGSTFSWSSDTNSGVGNIKIGTMHKDAGTGLWDSEAWDIAPDGTVTEA